VSVDVIANPVDRFKFLLALVCAAAKPDDHEAFVRKLCDLIDAAVDEAEERWLEERRTAALDHLERLNEDTCPHCRGEFLNGMEHWCRERAPLEFRLQYRAAFVADLSTGAAGETKAEEAKPSSPASAAETPAAPSRYRNFMTLEARRGILADYAAGRGTGGRAPNGLLERLADKWGYSYTTVKKLCYGRNKPERVAGAPPEIRIGAFEDLDTPADEPDHVHPNEKGLAGEKHDERIERAERPGKREPVPDYLSPREHTHSHACWCRKGPNTSASPWCSNTPSSGKTITLADPRSNMGRTPKRKNNLDHVPE